MSSAAKNFDILASSSSVLHNYFDKLTKFGLQRKLQIAIARSKQKDSNKRIYVAWIRIFVIGQAFQSNGTISWMRLCVVCMRRPISPTSVCDSAWLSFIGGCGPRLRLRESRTLVSTFARCCVPWEIENTPNSVDATKRDNVSPECESDPLSVAAGC